MEPALSGGPEGRGMAELVSEGGRRRALIMFDDGMCQSIDVTGLAQIDPTEEFLEGILSYVNTLKPWSQISHLTTLARCVGDGMESLAINVLPNTEAGWQRLLFRVFEHHFSRSDVRRSVKTAVMEWNSVVAPTIERLQDSVGIVPLGVVVPRAPNRLEKVDVSGAQASLIGQRFAKEVSGTIDKLLVSVSISRTDPDYLEEIRNELSYRRKILYDCLVQWWRQIKAHFDYGQTLLAGVDWFTLKQELDLRMTRNKQFGCKPLTKGSTRETLANKLAVISYSCSGTNSQEARAKSPYLYSWYTNLCLPPDVPEALGGITLNRRIDWMLGELWKEDVKYCAALLIMLNPSWTPYAILDAKVKDPYGKPYLEINDGIYRFRVDKPRARAKKESQLDALSSEIIETVLRASAKQRMRLRDANAHRAEYLFLLSAKSDPSLRGVEGNLYKVFPVLESVLPPGTINLKRIRATEGVLEWFRTGSVQAMRKKLGNTTRVILHHYLPAPLLAAWNVRLIRRFQNLWVSVAAAKEDFLLDVTDFHSIEDLHIFLADMLKLHAPSTSPLAEELHRVLGEGYEREQHNQQDNHSSLAISVSQKSLLALYLYQVVAIDSGVEPDKLEIRDAVTGFRPRDFINLAVLLRSEIPRRGDSYIRAAHDSAVQKIPQYQRRLKWGDLLLRIGNAR